MYKSIVFDLDDTLLDTRAQLVPPALKEALNALEEKGLSIPFDEAHHAFEVGYFPWPKLIEAFAETHDHVLPTEDYVDLFVKKFYERDVLEDIFLHSDVVTLLDQLKSANHLLLLLTAGSTKTQTQKIKKLNLQTWFSTMSIADPNKGESKTQKLKQLLEQHQLTPQETLVVGDRYESEIMAAIELGCPSALIERHAPRSPGPDPTHTLASVTDVWDLVQ